MPPNIGVFFKRVFNRKLLKNPLASYFYAAHFDKSIIFLLLLFETFGFKLSVSFLDIQQYNNIVLIYIFFLL